MVAFGPDSTTYRFNLEHVGYLQIRAREIYVWCLPVGRNEGGYRITLWAPAAEQMSMADWNRPPSPREWLNAKYRDDSPRSPGSYNFRDSIEEASYYRDLLRLALADELAGPERWATLHLWDPPRKLRQTRGEIMESLRVFAVGWRNPSGFVALPSIRWALFNEPDPSGQHQAMNLLKDVHSASADSLIIEIITTDHENAAVLAEALSLASDRGITIPRSALLPYTRSYRPSIAGPAIALNDRLGYPRVKAPATKDALHSSGVQQMFKNLEKLLVPTLGSDPRLVSIAWRFPDSEGAARSDTTRGWMVSEDSTSKTVLRTDGRYETISWKKSSGHDLTEGKIGVSVMEPSIAGEAARIIALRTSPRLESDDAWLHELMLGDAVSPIHDLLTAYKLQMHQDSRAAEVLLPTLDATGGESALLDAAQVSLGQIPAYRMLKAFAGDRDYDAAMREARLIIDRYPNSLFVDRARELARQLPLRKNDFKSFRLPTSEEWATMRSRMSRPEQLRFLCERLRLLSGPRGRAQFAEPPGMDALVSDFLGRGKTPVINPLIELRRGKVDTVAGKATPQSSLTVADIPALAPYLLDDWFTGEIDIPERRLSEHDPSDPERTITGTREIVAGLIQSLLPHNICQIEYLNRMSEAERGNRVDRIIAWAERNKDRDRDAQIVDAVNESQEYYEILPLMDYLIEHKIKKAVPKLVSFLNADPDYTSRWFLLSACRKIDCQSCAPVARKFVQDRNYMAQFNAGLILYESGAKVDGLLAMAAGFENDNGCMLRTGDPVEEAVSLLLSSHGTAEREVARLPLKAQCFYNSAPEDQWPLVRIFSDAGHPDGLEVFLRALSDSSVIGQKPIGEKTFPIRRNEEAARFILTNVMPPQHEVKFEYDDPPQKRSATVVAVRNWLTQHVAKMKKLQQN